MRILDRYLIKNFLLPLFYCLILFNILYIIIDIFGHLDEILRNKVPFGILCQYYTSFIPLIFVQTLPITTLLSMVYMLSAMNRFNELTAIKACGISISRLLLPVFVIGLLLSLSVFLINEKVVSKTIIKAEGIKQDYIEKTTIKKKGTKAVTDLVIYGEKNQMIYAKRFDPADNKLSDIIILESDEKQRMRRKIIADEGVWRHNKWVFFNCSIFRFDEFGQPIGGPLVFEKKTITLSETPNELLKLEQQVSYMNYKELKDYVRRLPRASSKTINNLKTDLYFKTALPFICLVIMLLGIPFAIKTTMAGAMADIGISITAGLLYYASIYLSLALGKGGLLPSFAAAHLPNILFFGLSLFMLKRSLW